MFDYIKNKKYLVIMNNELVMGFESLCKAQDYIEEKKKTHIFHANDKIEIVKRDLKFVENDGWS